MESENCKGVSSRCHVVAIPYPGRGHINPMLNICRLLSTRNILISFIVTEEWLELLDVNHKESLPNLHIRTIPNVIPSERTRGTEQNGFVQAVYANMEAPVEKLIQRLTPPVTSVITSSILKWAAEIAKRRMIPVSSLCTESPSVFLAFHQFDSVDTNGQEDESSGKENEALAYLPCASHFGGVASDTPPETVIRMYKQILSWYTKSQALLFTSSYELDSQVIDTLRSSLSIPIYTLGPSIPYMTLDIDPTDMKDSYFKWLDAQPISSVIYVALGSFLPVSADQMTEIAIGLQKSRVRFLWVARGEIEQIKENCGCMGLVVPWCDQLKVLCHPSVGGFLTHCGWNSILEGTFSGIPMLTLPLFWDQYPNSKLIVDNWMVGSRLRDEKEVNGVVSSEHITEMVKELMEVESVKSKQIRERARELKERCRKAVEEEGSLSKNLDSFVQIIESEGANGVGISEEKRK